jgi:hypothetical protein
LPVPDSYILGSELPGADDSRSVTPGDGPA